ncbi:CidA/LrgA family protein [Oceanobacillus iheyensis]|uniref:CidA/LrgA family protein n=1 Tax=Oceanobacillus iheyensis TaxID=182710 RepID=UPI003633A205
MKVVYVGKVIIHTLLLIFLYQMGTWIHDFLNLTLPGSVIGMMLLFVLLSTGLVKPSWVDKGALLLVKHLPLFFIPATVGIISFLHLFAGSGIFLIAIIIVSTALVIVISGHVSQWLVRKKELKHD